MQEIKLTITHPSLPQIINYRQLCLECDLAELAGYYGKSYSLPFCGYLDFSYDGDRSKKIADRFTVTKNLIEQCARCGARIKKTAVTDTETYDAYLTERIESGAPVIAHLDCYYVPWDRLRGQFHNKHTVIVAGARKDAYYASDPYFGESGWVEKSVFRKGSSYYFETDLTACAPPDTEAFRKAFENKLAALSAEGYYSALELLSRDIVEENIPASEIEELVAVFTQIELNKQRFMMFLHEWESSEKHHGYTSEYNKIWSRWQVLKIMTVKAGYGKFDERSRRRISEYLLSTRREEERCLNGLSAQKGTLVTAVGRSADITAYCNNKGLSVSRRNVIADCTGFGEYVEVKKQRAALSERGYILLPEKSMDNIVCEGQEIPITVDPTGKSITLLVSAEWGDHGGVFKFVYADGTATEKRVCVRDWKTKGQNRSEIGSTYYLEDRRVKQMHKVVYADEIAVTLEKSKTLEKIVLPECGNIHIFAIKTE